MRKWARWLMSLLAVGGNLAGAVFVLVRGGVPYVNAPMLVILALVYGGAWLTKDKKEEPEMNTCPRCRSAAALSSNPFNLCASCNAQVMLPQGGYAASQIPGYAQGGSVNVPFNLSSQLSQRPYLTIGRLGATPTPVTQPSFQGRVEERAEPVYGWRAYRVTNGGVLMGVRAEWPERNFTATCGEGIRPDEETVKVMLRDDVAYRFWLERQRGSGESFCVTHLESGICSCGVYLRAKPEPYDPQFIIYAKVLAYGVVALDEDGNARASEVQIEALYVVPAESPEPLFEYVDWGRLGNVLRGRYDVPVQVVGSLDALTEATAGASIPKARG